MQQRKMLVAFDFFCLQVSFSYLAFCGNCCDFLSSLAVLWCDIIVAERSRLSRILCCTYYRLRLAEKVTFFAKLRRKMGVIRITSVCLV